MNEQIAYLAGLMDGEGTFSIQIQVKKGRINVGARMSMTLHYGTEVLDLLVKHFGGSIYPYPNAKRWSLGGKEALTFATHTLLPYLHIKKESAEKFLAALKLIPGRGHHGAGWTEAKLQEVISLAFSMNPGGGEKASSAKVKKDVASLGYAVQ